MRGLDKNKGPFTATVLLKTPFNITFETLTIGERLQTATHPTGLNAVTVVWEVNDLLPYDGSQYHSATAAFAGPGKAGPADDLIFDVMASLDGKQFTKIATVKGPANQYVHKAVTPGWLYYYKVVARDKAGAARLEGAATPGAAGENLAKNGDFEDIPVGPCSPKETYGDTLHVKDASYSIADGARPYSTDKHILQVKTQSQKNYDGAFAPISPAKSYLQGGWIRSESNLWYGRYFHEKGAGGHRTYNYAAVGIRDGSSWTFVAQWLTPEQDRSAFPRTPEGHLMGMGEQDYWLFPPEADRMATLLVAFGAGAADDLWIVEAVKAPEGSVVQVPPAE